MKTKKITSKRVIWIGLLLIILYFFVWGDYNLLTLWQLHSRKQELQKQIAQQETRKKQLATEIEKLQSDSSYIEKVAREQFKMGREGEKVYIIKEQDSK